MAGKASDAARGPAQQFRLSATDQASPAIPLVVLASGHMLSNLLRTLPALGVDVMAGDLGLAPETLASLTSIYHLAFAAGQILVGVALDRMRVKAVSLFLLAGAMLGCTMAAMAQGPLMFVLAQMVLGLATSGMLLCPMALAAQLVPAQGFGLWTGITLGLGNTGMLLSASPLAWLIANVGWRPAFWIACASGLVIAALVLRLVPTLRPAGNAASLTREIADVARLACSRSLRAIMILAFASLAVVLVMRGLWAGPWLMDVKGASRMEAGHALLFFTLALIVGPILAGVLDRGIGHRRCLVGGGQMLAALLLLTIASGAPGGPLAEAFDVAQVAWPYDIALLVAIGLFISVQPLLFAMAHQMVSGGELGKAMSAVNLSFFLGTAVLQACTGFVALWFGIAAVLVFLGVILLMATAAFLLLTRRSAT